MLRRAVLLSLAAAVLVGGSAQAAAPESCGAPRTTKVITGTFTTDQTGSFVMLPFDVPKGTTAIRAWYCYDQPDGVTAQLPAYAIRHTLDFGYYAPRPAGQRLWSMQEYRGWSGSGFFKDITVSPRGYSANPDPSKKTVGDTSRGYRPGPITPGTWAVELGLAAIVSPQLGDSDGSINWRVELLLEDDPQYATPKYAPAKYDTTPVKTDSAWYAGDFHVHTDQSGDAKQNAVAKDVFDYAFKPHDQGGAGLDFVQATDHNTDAGWGEWQRLRSAYPGKLIARNEEITTYRGHINAPAIKRLADYRTGPVFERDEASGKLTQLRASRPVSQIFDAVHETDGVATINHPTIFDSSIPPLGIICRGCSWEYDDGETQFSKVDAIEVETGTQGLKIDLHTGPNPFTPLAIGFYEDAMRKGNRQIAAVSGSDSHTGGNSPADDITGAPVGSPATMVYAKELSEQGIADAVKAGHTYIRSFGKDSPELEYHADAGNQHAINGDTLYEATTATFSATIKGKAAGPEPMILNVTKNGFPYQLQPLSDTGGNVTFTVDAPAGGTDHYGLTLMRGTAIELVSTPIFITRGKAPPPPAPAAKDPLRVRGLAARTPKVRNGRFTVRCRAKGDDLKRCAVTLRRSGRTLGSGKATVTRPQTRKVSVRLNAAGRKLLRTRKRVAVTIVTTVTDTHGKRRTHHRRATLRR